MADQMRELRPILRTLREQGWRIVEQTRRGAMMAYPPDVEQRPVPIHRTPSDQRWRKNLLATLRRAGADL